MSEDILLSWSFPEFTKHQRSRAWYLWFFVTIVGLIGMSLLTTNYTFIAVVIMAALVLILRFRREPAQVPVEVTAKGISVGGRPYAWTDFKDFWIIYRPPQVKQLYLTFKSLIRPELNIGLTEQNPLKIREILREHLLENIEREEEPGAEQLARYFKM